MTELPDMPSDNTLVKMYNDIVDVFEYVYDSATINNTNGEYDFSKGSVYFKKELAKLLGGVNVL